MKKKLVSILSTFWLSLTNKTNVEVNTMIKSEPFLVEAKLQLFEKEKIKTTNKELENLVNKLNELKVNILVTLPFDNKENGEVLLSLVSEARLDSEQALIDYRHRKLLLTRLTKQPLTYILKKDRYSIFEIIREKCSPVHARIYRNAKSYSVENFYGYKSICPIFFDKNSAENFLIKSSKEMLILLNNIPSKSNKEILKGILNTQIKSVGLGDLIDYFSSLENEKFSNKLEFLFVPYLEDLDNLNLENKKKIEDIIKTESFASYQTKFLKLRKKF